MKTSFVLKGISALLSITGVAAAPATNGKNDDKSCSSGPKPRVSVKQVSNFCETTPGVKSYSGYVTLPPSTNYPFEQNIFFWLFESRNRPKSDPLTVWINGGPGSPSTDQALGSNGPCRVQPDSKTTKLNADSWNNKANLLYIDQPVQTGFSYNNVTPGRLGLIGGFVYPEGTSVPDYETVLFNGSFSTQDPNQTLNTTQSIARVLWDFMQVWQEEKKLKDFVRPSINLWSQSYGGHYVPAIATYFEARSKLATTGKLPPNPRICSRAKSIRIATVGIIAPFIDIVGQFADLEFALNNTYGIEIFDPATVDDLVEQAEAPGGCFDLIDDCRNITNRLDPEGWGNAPEVYPVCNNAFFSCYQLIESRYEATGRDSFDITQPAAAQFPPPYAFGFLNRQNTQSRLGVPVNYTAFSPSIQYPFFATGDFLLSFAPHVERLLAADIPGKDVATGKKAIGNGAKYATSGPKDIRGTRTPLPPKAPVFCYTASTPIVRGQCTDAQIAALADGTAVVKDFVVVQPAWSG
ncbi:Zinc finger protein GLI3 [Verticillium dahliae VDG1]|nr:Zinc finger protein GLI3 [Verticillium dahliae VDG1]